jgi:uncharacterized linocin/CFP29 family protein
VSSSHLLREHAPITEEGWRRLDEEARERVVPALAARKLVDFSGPHGWKYSSTNLGRTERVSDGPEGIQGAIRSVLPVVEARAPFAVARSELDDADRGAEDIDLDELDAAALSAAVAENAAIFHGWSGAGITGIADATPHEAISLGEDCERYPRHVAKAVDTLRAVGIDGPYGLALSPEAHTNVLETSQHGGYPLLEHLREILGGPLVWAPGVKGAVVLSVGGGHFLFESGQDLSIGYASHDEQSVQLYLEETFSFRVATPEAAVALTP